MMHGCIVRALDCSLSLTHAPLSTHLDTAAAELGTLCESATRSMLREAAARLRTVQDTNIVLHERTVWHDKKGREPVGLHVLGDLAIKHAILRAIPCLGFKPHPHDLRAAVVCIMKSHGVSRQSQVCQSIVHLTKHGVMQLRLAVSVQDGIQRHDNWCKHRQLDWRGSRRDHLESNGCGCVIG